MANAIDFNAPDLAARDGRPQPSRLDRLPFGVILLDREGTVLFYSETEARQSGYNKTPARVKFLRGVALHGARRFPRPDHARDGIRSGRSRIRLVRRFRRPQRDMRIRVQSARQGGVWILIERDPAVAKLAASG